MQGVLHITMVCSLGNSESVHYLPKNIKFFDGAHAVFSLPHPLIFDTILFAYVPPPGGWVAQCLHSVAVLNKAALFVFIAFFCWLRTALTWNPRSQPYVPHIICVWVWV